MLISTLDTENDDGGNDNDVDGLTHPEVDEDDVDEDEDFSGGAVLMVLRMTVFQPDLVRRLKDTGYNGVTVHDLCNRCHNKFVDTT